MTTMNKLSRNYDKLKREERLSLLLDAINRDDNDQAEILTESAPMGTYNQRDVWTMGRVDASFKISILYWLSIEEICGSIIGARYAKCQFESVVSREGKSEEAHEIFKNRIASLEENILSSLKSAKSLRYAIKMLADEINMDVESLLAYVPNEILDKLNGVDALESVLYPNDLDTIDNDLPPDDHKEALEGYYSLFRRFWPKDMH